MPLRIRRKQLSTAALVFVVLASVIAIATSQTLADWWSGGNSGNTILDGPLGGVRAIRSVLEFGWLGDGVGVHLVMWWLVVMVLLRTFGTAPVPLFLPLLTGTLIAVGMVLELVQGAWTLRNPSVGDIVGNLLGVGIGVAVTTREAWRSGLPARVGDGR